MDNERRKCYRVQYPGYVAASVRVGRKRFICQLVDESAVAVRFIVNGPFPTHLGEQLLLSTTAGTWTVRVLRVERKGEETIVACDRGDGAISGPQSEEPTRSAALRQPPRPVKPLLGIGLAVFVAISGGFLYYSPRSEMIPRRVEMGFRAIGKTKPEEVEFWVEFTQLQERTTSASLNLTPLQQFRAAVVLAQTSRALRARIDHGDEDPATGAARPTAAEVLNQAELQLQAIFGNAPAEPEKAGRNGNLP